mmetsp:Transcript_57797/g.154502  ORF Transcript_57797/g.154502 Transcript_57797/m.154502 type:complete len:246 (+) Transcript_57797:463-1200(+)
MAPITWQALLLSSISMPKSKGGLSFEAVLLPFHAPLLIAHSSTLRSLSSVYEGFFSRKASTTSNVPSSGMPTGNTTVLFAAGAGAALVSAAEAPCTMRHLKGRGFIGLGPKFVCTVTLRKVICGKRGLPLSLSGNGIGSVTRTPSLKRLTVLAFSLVGSRLRSKPTTFSRQNLFACLGGDFFPSARKEPSPSKPMQSSPSPRMSDDPSVEKPSRTICFPHTLLRCPWCCLPSSGASTSTTFASYK